MLTDSGFVSIVGRNASKPLAQRRQDAIPEERREEESKKESREEETPLPPEGASVLVPTPELLMSIYNEERGEKIPECRAMTPERRTKCKKRIESQGRDPTKFVEDWRAVMRKAVMSPFLSGESETGWVMSFDWLIKNDTNYLKVLEGKYDRSKSPDAPPPHRHTERCKDYGYCPEASL
jgi:hypothetical protein